MYCGNKDASKGGNHGKGQKLEVNGARKSPRLDHVSCNRRVQAPSDQNDPFCVGGGGRTPGSGPSPQAFPCLSSCRRTCLLFLYIKPPDLAPHLFSSSLTIHNIVMLATSTMMLESSSSRADPANPRRHSFSSFVRNLMLLISPSSSADDDSDSTTTASDRCGDCAADQDAKKNSQFLEMYFSFPALEDPDTEANSCAADHHIHNSSTGASFIVPTGRVLC